MYDGQSGRMFEADFYYGATYYQRLKHMVVDKIHSRDQGPVQLLNRQPAEGRARDGGHRFGEMERDSMISHGASGFLKETFMDKSDAFSRYVDKTSGRLVIGNKEADLFKLNNNDRLMRSDVTEIQIPYALDLAFKEMNAMNIGFKLKV
jgi:DNA-directed RNA polymerase II subunit RPB2